MPYECEGCTADFGSARRGSTPRQGTMENNEIVECPSCKGKGRVLSVAAFLNPIAWFFFAPPDSQGMRETCRRCYGKGFIKVEAYERPRQ